MPKLILSLCKRKMLPWMDVEALYVLISRVRKFSDLRLLQYDEEGLKNAASKQHDVHLHAWVHGYDSRGRWQPSLAAAALADIRKVRRAEEARRKDEQDRETARRKTERDAEAKTRRDEAKAARATAAKARQDEARAARMKAARQHAPACA